MWGQGHAALVSAYPVRAEHQAHSRYPKHCQMRKLGEYEQGLFPVLHAESSVTVNFLFEKMRTFSPLVDFFLLFSLSQFRSKEKLLSL